MLLSAVPHIDIRKRVAIVRKDGLSVKIVSMELNHSRAKINAFLTTFGSKSPSFGPSSNRTINILTTFGSKSPSFGPSYRTPTTERLSTVSSPYMVTYLDDYMMAFIADQ